MFLKYIETGNIRPPKFLLRPVRKDSVEYQEMVDSIKDNGLWQPVLVRPLDDGQYELVEGNWRYNCCKQLRFETIPCIVRDLTDEEVLLAQLQANGIRPETSPVEFSERLALILHNNPAITVPKLALMVRKSPNWIRKILRLGKLRSVYSQMVRRGEIPLESACALARLNPQLQDVYIQHALMLSVNEFVKLAMQEVKKYREAAKNAYIDRHPINQDKPVPYMRKVIAIRDEFNKPAAAGPVLLKTEAQTPMDGWTACLAWILHMDPESLEVQNQMIVARQKQQQRAAKRRQHERQKLRELRMANGEPNLVTLELDT